MKQVPIFDIESFLSTDFDPYKICVSELAGLEAEYIENQSIEISKLADLADFNENKNLTDEDIINLLNHATHKTRLTASHFWRFCDAYDIADVYKGEFTQKLLQAYAKSWARYPETVLMCNDHPFPDSQTKLVKCLQCQNFEPDKIGDGTVVGQCHVNAPAQNMGLLWPNLEKLCEEYESTFS